MIMKSKERIFELYELATLEQKDKITDYFIMILFSVIMLIVVLLASIFHLGVSVIVYMFVLSVIILHIIVNLLTIDTLLDDVEKNKTEEDNEYQYYT
jgi:hypothetical protein